MGAALQKLRTDNSLESNNTGLDNGAERDEKECQKEEITSEKEMLLTMISRLEKEIETKSKAYEVDHEIYREALQWKNQKIQQLESMKEGALAIEKPEDEEIAALASALALEKAVCKQQNEESARMQKLKDEEIDVLKSTVKTLNEENAKLSKKIEEQNKDFKRQLEDKDEKISKLELLIEEKDEAAVKRDKEMRQMMAEAAERQKEFEQELEKRDKCRDKKYDDFEKRQKNTVEQMLKKFAASHIAGKNESSYLELFAYENEGKNDDNEYKKSEYEN